MRKHFKLILALLTALSLLAAACGSTADTATDAVTDVVDEATDAVDGEDEDEAMEDEEEDEAMEDEEEEAMEDEESSDGEAVAGGDTDTSVGLVYDIGGRGDLSFNDSAAAGLDRAESDLGIGFVDLSPNDDGSNRGELLQTAADDNPIVIGVGFLFEGDAAATAAENPDTNFAVVDSAMINFDLDPPGPYGPNVAGLVFAEEQGSYLVGVAAALTSETNQLGFIGGVSGIGLIERFEAGFRAGALSVNPDIEVVAEYITAAPDFDGFNQPDRAQVIATTMFEDGADVIYHAAGGAGNGMFQAAADFSDDNGSKVWGIGVDSDQFQTVGVSNPELQEFILTSMLKRVDVAVFEILQAQQEGTFSEGTIVYDLSVDGVGYATSGGFIDDIVPDIEAAREAIVAGDVVVPTDPTEVGG